MTPKRNELSSKRSHDEQLKDSELPDDVDYEMPDKLATKSQVVEEMLVDLDDF